MPNSTYSQKLTGAEQCFVDETFDEALANFVYRSRRPGNEAMALFG